MKIIEFFSGNWKLCSSSGLLLEKSHYYLKPYKISLNLHWLQDTVGCFQNSVSFRKVKYGRRDSYWASRILRLTRNWEVKQEEDSRISILKHLTLNFVYAFGSSSHFHYPGLCSWVINMIIEIYVGLFEFLLMVTEFSCLI